MLVTLKSTSHDNGISTDESASNWTNYFKEGIHFSPDSTVQVVSCSINKTDDFIIEAGINDAFIYAIGETGPLGADDNHLGPYSQHRVVIPAGAYTGTSLADEIQNQLENSTTLGSMKGSWSVFYEGPSGTPANPSPASFLIDWNQNNPPVPYDPDCVDTITYSGCLPGPAILYLGAPPSQWVPETINLVGAPLKYAKFTQDVPNFNEIGGDDHIGIGGLIYDGAKVVGSELGNDGIACVGGNVNVVIPPTNVISELTLISPIHIQNWDGPGLGRDAGVTPVNPSIYNGYEYTFEISNDLAGTIDNLTPLPGVDGLKEFELVGGGDNWIVGDTGLIVSALPGLGNFGSFEVLTVDSNNNDALLTYRLQNPGENYQPGDVLDFLNPNLAGADGTGTVTTVLADMRGTNLEPDGVYYLTTALAGGTGPPPVQAELMMDTVGPFGEYLTSSFWDRGSDYSNGDIVYINNPLGENAWFEVTSLADGYDIYFAHVTGEGAMGLSLWANPKDLNSPNFGPSASSNLSTEWDLGFKVGGDENFPMIEVGADTYLFEINLDPNGIGVVGELYGNSPNTPWLLGSKIIGATQVLGINSPLPIVYQMTYPATTLGYVRQQLKDIWQDSGPFVGENGHHVNLDLRVTLLPSIDNTDAHIFIDQLQMVGNTFPNGSMIPIYNSEITAIPGLQGFQMGDWINLTIDINQYTTVSVNAYHDTQGNGVWVANTDPLVLSGITEVPGQQLVTDRGAIFESNLRECMYPLMPVILTDLGTGFSPATLPRTADIALGMATPYITGTVDNKNRGFSSAKRWVYDYETLVTGTSMDDSLFHSIPNKDPATVALMPYFYKFSQLRGLDEANTPLRNDSHAERALWNNPEGFGSGTGGLVPPNTANIGYTLAMYDVYNFDADPATEGIIQSQDDKHPQPDTRNPTIQIELPDFGVKSFSGASHDTGRAVCVIPREQFTTDSRTGTLHYESNYPVVIELNCKDDIVLNHISCRLRNLDGRLATVLNPTQVTLLIKDSEASVQATAYERAMERISEKDSNRIATMNAHSIAPI